MLEAKNLEKQILIKKIDSKTLNIKIFDNKMLMAVVGEFNNNLNELEKLTNTQLFFRGNSITAKGDKDSILNILESIKYLANKFIVTNSIEKDDPISDHDRNEYLKKYVYPPNFDTSSKFIYKT